MKVKISIGEALDKLSILHIKKEKIKDVEKLKNVNKEHGEILNYCENLLKEDSINSLFDKLIDVNSKLWQIEDEIRKKEMNKQFDEEFINLARSVYITNDHRADIKKQINLLTSSEIVEEKSYEKY
jgi:hypothetical protein